MKPVILVFTRYYLPGYRAGGPIRTIANMVERLGDDFEFRIVTQDRDLGDHQAFSGIPPDAWLPQGKGFVRYVSRNRLCLSEIVDLARSTPHAVIYLNGFFDPCFTLRVVILHRLGRFSGRPVVIAPRGEFSDGALRIKSIKKKVYIRLVKLLRLYEGLTWQGSSEMEAADIRRAYFDNESMSGRVVVSRNVTVAPDVTALSNDGPSPAVERRLRGNGYLNICFLGRISQMKNLDFALRTLELVRVPVRFAIYGPIEDKAYWVKCEEIIARLPANIDVVYEGEVEPTQVVSKLAQYDLFLFPTRGENFGHVIHEALRAGLPLLISDQTPWQNLEAQGVGWSLPLDDMTAFAQKIEQVAGWSAVEYSQGVKRAHALAASVSNDRGAVAANRQMFLDAIGGPQQTYCQDRGREVDSV